MLNGIDIGGWIDYVLCKAHTLPLDPGLHRLSECSIIQPALFKVRSELAYIIRDSRLNTPLHVAYCAGITVVVRELELLNVASIYIEGRAGRADCRRREPYREKICQYCLPSHLVLKDRVPGQGEASAEVLGRNSANGLTQKPAWRTYFRALPKSVLLLYPPISDSPSQR